MTRDDLANDVVRFERMVAAIQAACDRLNAARSELFVSHGHLHPMAVDSAVVSAVDLAIVAVRGQLAATRAAHEHALAFLEREEGAP